MEEIFDDGGWDSPSYVDSSDPIDIEAETSSEPARHPLWDIDGIPEPTKADLKWWKKHKKTNKSLEKSLRKCANKNFIWRTVKLLEFRDLQTAEQKFDLNSKRGLIGIGLEMKQFINQTAADDAFYHSNFKILQMLMYQDSALLNHLYTKDSLYTEAREKLFESQQWDLLITMMNKNLLQASSVEHLFKKALEHKDTDIFKRILDGHHNLEKRKIWNILDSQNAEEVFYRAVDEKYPEPKKPKRILNIQDTEKSDAHKTWQKYEETSIWHNKPFEDNGTRLRELFDFASRRVKEYQQMPDGQLNALNDWDFGDFSGFIHLMRAKEELEKQGGETNPKSSLKTAKTSVDPTAKPSH